jgi:hypothetical protein
MTRTYTALQATLELALLSPDQKPWTRKDFGRTFLWKTHVGFTTFRVSSGLQSSTLLVKHHSASTRNVFSLWQTKSIQGKIQRKCESSLAKNIQVTNAPTTYLPCWSLTKPSQSNARSPHHQMVEYPIFGRPQVQVCWHKQLWIWQCQISNRKW